MIEINLTESPDRAETLWEFYYRELEDILTEKEWENFLWLHTSNNPFISRPRPELPGEMETWLRDYSGGWMTKEELRGKFYCVDKISI